MIEPWTTYRTTKYSGRITYHPEWDKMQPWASYINGTAGRHFATVEAARIYFASQGLTLKDEPES